MTASRFNKFNLEKKTNSLNFDENMDDSDDDITVTIDEIHEKKYFNIIIDNFSNTIPKSYIATRKHNIVYFQDLTEPLPANKYGWLTLDSESEKNYPDTILVSTICEKFVSKIKNIALLNMLIPIKARLNSDSCCVGIFIQNILNLDGVKTLECIVFFIINKTGVVDFAIEYNAFPGIQTDSIENLICKYKPVKLYYNAMPNSLHVLYFTLKGVSLYNKYSDKIKNISELGIKLNRNKIMIDTSLCIFSKLCKIQNCFGCYCGSYLCHLFSMPDLPFPGTSDTPQNTLQSNSGNSTQSTYQATKTKRSIHELLEMDNYKSNALKNFLFSDIKLLRNGVLLIYGDSNDNNQYKRKKY